MDGRARQGELLPPCCEYVACGPAPVDPASHPALATSGVGWGGVGMGAATESEPEPEPEPEPEIVSLAAFAALAAAEPPAQGRFAVGGRVCTKRVCGRVAFFELSDGGAARLQVIAESRTCGASAYDRIRHTVAVGDFARFSGSPGRSKRGQLSMLTPTLLERGPSAAEATPAGAAGAADGGAAEPACRILYRDEHLLVADKPPDMLVHPDGPPAPGDRPTLLELLARQLGLSAKPRDHDGRGLHPLHRIDRDTSGAVMFALTAAAAKTVRAEWGTAVKRYGSLL